MGFKHNEEMQNFFYVAALNQFARFQARGLEELDPAVSWRGTSWDKIERFLNDMRTSFAAHSLSKLERAVIPRRRDGNEYKLDPVTHTALLGYDIVLHQIRFLCALYMQHIMENKLPREVANAVPDCMKLSSEEMEKNETYKHDDPVDISKAGNMKDPSLHLHVIPDSENPGDKDAYNKALSDEENIHDVKNAKEFAEQWRDMQKQQQVDWMTLVQVVVCGSNALTVMHRAITGRESGRSSHVADVIT
jgi:diadenosine tetraphosphate (Ap4A) HIT family hydrolase